MGTQYETQYKDGETPDHISSATPSLSIYRSIAPLTRKDPAHGYIDRIDSNSHTEWKSDKDSLRQNRCFEFWKVIIIIII